VLLKIGNQLHCVVIDHKKNKEQLTMGERNTVAVVSHILESTCSTTEVEEEIIVDTLAGISSRLTNMMSIEANQPHLPVSLSKKQMDTNVAAWKATSKKNIPNKTWMRLLLTEYPDSNKKTSACHCKDDALRTRFKKRFPPENIKFDDNNKQKWKFCPNVEFTWKGDWQMSAINSHYTMTTKVLGNLSFVCAETEKEHMAGTYGHLSKKSLIELLTYLVEHTGLGDSSQFMDLGTGLHGPALFASLLSGCRACGIEKSQSRAYTGVAHLIEWVAANPNVPDVCCKSAAAYFNGDIFEIGARDLDTTTHLYCYDSAFTPELKYHIVSIFLESSCQYGVFFHDGCGALLKGDEKPNGVDLIHSQAMSMAGSGGSRTVNVFRKKPGSKPSVPTMVSSETRFSFILRCCQYLTAVDRNLTKRTI
jgi:hypothetical protein